MERNAILATVMVILILVGYQWYLSHEAPAPAPEAPRAAKPSAEPAAKSSEPAISQSTPAAKSPTAKKTYTPTAETTAQAKDITVETPLMRIVFAAAGARVKTWELKRYRQSTGAPVELVARSTNALGPLSAWADPEQITDTYEVDRDKLDLSQPGSVGTLTFRNISKAGVLLEKQITLKADSYEVGVQMTAKNLEQNETQLQPKLVWGPGLRTSGDKDHGTVQPPIYKLEDSKPVHEDFAKLSKEKTIEGNVSWVALQDTYFAAALLADQNGLSAFLLKEPEGQAVIGLEAARKSVPSGGDLVLKANLYAGPRDLDTLKAAGHNLDQLIDLGWFDFLARPALWLLKTLYHFIGNYGLAIIVITILQKIVFWPLTYKSIKSMQAMQSLQPKVQAIQERYKNNPQKKQEETMALYKKQGVNPMGGCLPMLIQIPIFVALYNALSSSVEMWQAHFLWIHDLTQPDSLFRLTLWGGQEYNVGNLLGILMGASMWLQQKMSPTGGDPRQAQMMLWMMPILFTFMFWSFPSGLVLYWFVNNLLQIGQQWLINRQNSKPAEPQALPA